MQANNKLRVFSGNSTTGTGTYRRLADAALESTLAQNGAGYNTTADSALYNSLSLALSSPVVALVDFIAQYNSGTTFGQDLGINDWITAVGNAFATKGSVDGILNGTTAAGKADKLTTARTITVSGNGTNSSASFDGTGNISLTIGTATNATYAEYASTDTSKGTIEERLTSLGFREGAIQVSGTTILNLYRQGNYVFAVFNGGSYLINSLNGKYVPNEFKPKENITVLRTDVIYHPSGNLQTTVEINTSGYITVSAVNAPGFVAIKELSFGYEATPITT